jgi:hypothetical protein
MLEIDRYAPHELPELPVGARITDGVDGEGDMGSGWVDPPIRGGEGGAVGLREDSERQDR